MKTVKRELNDTILLAVVCLLVFLFLLPIARGSRGLFFDDIRTFNYPNAVFQARWLQKGIVPLWDPNTFAGASPFYARVDGFSWYLPQWITGLLSPARPSDRAYQCLVLFPMILHCLWAAAGAFILGRWGLRMSRTGAGLTALIYSLSSSLMLGGLTAPHFLYALAWQPWMAAAILLYLRRRSPLRLAAGAAIFTLGTTAWPVFGFHNLFSAGVYGFAAVLADWKGRGYRSAYRGALGLLGMLALSLLLAAPFWWALKDYTAWVQGSFNLGHQALAAGPRSVPIRYWAAVFVPELFGSSNFSTFWGVAADEKMYWSEAYLTRGMLIWFPAFLAAGAVIRSRIRRRRNVIPVSRGSGGGSREAGETGRPDFNPSQPVDGVGSLNLWTWVSLGMLALGVLMMSGRHTPVFAVLYRLCPIFRLPYPSRWHTVFTLGLAVLSGIGVTGLLDSRRAIPLLTRRSVAVYLLLVTLSAGAALLFPFGYWRGIWDINWFLVNPGLYWAVCSLLIGSLVLVPSRKWAGRMAVLLALAGLFRSAWWDAYRPMETTWAAEQEELTRPSESSLFRFMDAAARFDRDNPNRRGYSRVFADNIALLYGGYSLLGVSVKPLDPRMFGILEEICEGWPYEILLKNPGLPFSGNMSVEYWWHDRDTPPKGLWEYVEQSPPAGLFLYRNLSFLPRVFTLDRLRPATEAEQRQGLLSRDLREAVLVDVEDASLSGYIQGDKVLKASEVADYFNRLQSANRILEADFSHPNRVQACLQLTTPAMLVMTDVYHPGWRATDNGKPVTVHRVNYLQRGIWLEAGGHEIEMRFRPRAFYTGRWFSLAAVTVFLGGWGIWQGRRAGKNRRDCR